MNALCVVLAVVAAAPAFAAGQAVLQFNSAEEIARFLLPDDSDRVPESWRHCCRSTMPER